MKKTSLTLKLIKKCGTCKSKVLILGLLRPLRYALGPRNDGLRL